MTSEVYRTLYKLVKSIPVAVLMLSNSDSWILTEVNVTVPVILLIGQQ